MKNDRHIGCGTIVVGFFLIMLVLGLAATLWWLLLIAGVAGIVYYVYREAVASRNAKNRAEEIKRQNSTPVTVKCKFCGAVFDVPSNADIIQCEYCDSKMKIPEYAKNITRDIVPDEEQLPAKKPLLTQKQLLVISIICLILGVIGYAMS